MKYLFIFLMASIISYAQPGGYPKYSVDSLGQKVLILTIDQARKLDSKLDILNLFTQLDAQMKQQDTACIKVINDKERVIAVQKLQISSLNSSIEIKDAQLAKLQDRIIEYITQIEILEQQVENRKSVIDEKDSQIKKLKIKMLFGGIGGGLTILGLITGLVLIN